MSEPKAVSFETAFAGDLAPEPIEIPGMPGGYVQTRLLTADERGSFVGYLAQQGDLAKTPEGLNAVEKRLLATVITDLRLKSRQKDRKTGEWIESDVTMPEEKSGLQTYLSNMLPALRTWLFEQEMRRNGLAGEAAGE